MKEKTTLLDNGFQTIRDAIMMKTNVDQYRIVTHKSTRKVRLVNLLPVVSNLHTDVTELQVTYATSWGFEKVLRTLIIFQVIYCLDNKINMFNCPTKKHNRCVEPV